MNTEELNKHIKNYLENDKTNSAIMLTGAWGSGKSYYVKNKLTPYLWECGKHKCAAVSLYGITSLSDLSKAIFWELQFSKKAYLKKQKSKPENDKVKKTWFSRICKKGKSWGWLAVGFGKTLLKGLAKTKDIDLDINEKDLERVYKSVDTNGTLVILEDLERSSIDIIEVLGFVNNLVEQDGVKVLLVANEEEIIQCEDKEIKDTKGKTKKESAPTEKTKEYLRKKEKTISDTLVFEQTQEIALKNIIHLHFDKNLSNALTEDEYIADIVNVLSTVKSNNLRSVMFACQKTSDLIKLYEKSLDVNFIKFLLCSNIAFSCRIKNGEDCVWKDKETSPAALGTAAFPLYKVCYDFIKNQRFIKSLLEQVEQAYLKRKKIEEGKTEFNKHFAVLSNYYIRTEEEVSNAIIQIKELLKKNEGVEYTQYAVLANYLIAVRDCVDNTSDIEECKTLMLQNIRGIGNEDDIESEILYHSGIQFDDPKDNQELAEFKKKLLEEINFKKKEIFVFDSSVESIRKFIDYVQHNRSEYINEGSFAKNIPIPEFIEALKMCDANLIMQIRSIFLSIYSSSNIKDFLSNDKDTLELLKGEIQTLKDTYDGFDKIQKKQLKWFINNLEGIIDKLS